MRIYDLLEEDYKTTKNKWLSSAESNTIDEIIKKFKDLINRNQIKGDEREIDWWGKNRLKSLKILLKPNHRTRLLHKHSAKN